MLVISFGQTTDFQKKKKKKLCLAEICSESILIFNSGEDKVSETRVILVVILILKYPSL